MYRGFFGQSLNQFVIMPADEVLHPFCHRRIIDSICDVVVKFGDPRPQRHVQAQALRFGALGIRHAHPSMDFELLNVNTIDHDSWNFGEKHIGPRAPILIAQSSERQARRTYLGVSEATIFSKRAPPRNGSQYGWSLADRNLNRGFGSIPLVSYLT